MVGCGTRLRGVRCCRCQLGVEVCFGCTPVFGSPEPDNVNSNSLKVVRLDLGCHSWAGRVAYEFRNTVGRG